MARHGTRTCYNDGCRCDKCKIAEANYQKKRRHGTDDATVVSLPGAASDVVDNPEPKPIGPCEAQAIATLANTPATVKRPDLFQAALAMARIMDNPVTVAQHVQAAARYTDISALLMKGADDRKSRLAAVREMSKPKTEAV